MGQSSRSRRRLALAALGLAGGLVAGAWVEQRPAQDGGRREFLVRGSNFRFEPSRLEVRQNDLVKITFQAEDIPHSFTVDAYRIAKRASAHGTVTFEFRADRAGTFPFYCNLTVDERCAEMRGELIVRGP